jgi:TolA-binding protein
MKNIILSLLAITAVPVSGAAQLADTMQVGKVIYFEGRVETGNGTEWKAVTLNAPLRVAQFIKTSPEGTAEIAWINGAKTVVGPGSRMEVRLLFENSSNSAKAETEGVFSGFMKMFKTTYDAKRSEEGGIRRSMAEVRSKPTPKEMYWKEEKEMTFEEATALYENKEYAKAIAAFQAFINQKPRDKMVKFAYFAMGHSYIMVNNPVKAREIFQNFVANYSNDPLKAEAEKVLAKL